MHPNTRYKTLLENERVSDWYDNLAARSDETADIYLRNFGLWLERIGEDPDSIIELAKNDLELFRRKILRQVRLMEKDVRAGSYIGVSLRPVVSYLKFYDVVVRLTNINIKDEDKHRTVENERIPTEAEFRSVLDAASLRQKAIISLVGFSGIRPQSIGKKFGNDGLTLGDIPELKIEGNNIYLEKVPALVKVRSEISKSEKRYHTYMGEQAFRYIEDYLKQRMREGEKLGPKSPLIGPDVNMSRLEMPNRFLMTTKVESGVKKAIKNAGFNWRPYIFRHYFGVKLDMSEGRGYISHSWRMHIMGHVGDIEATYSTNKPLPDDLIDQMREAYKKCLEYIQTEVKQIPEEDSRRILKDAIIGTFEVLPGNKKLTDEERETLISMSVEEIQEELREMASKIQTNALNNGRKQKVIPQTEIKHYIEDLGWEYVKDLNNRESIVKIAD